MLIHGKQIMGSWSQSPASTGSAGGLKLDPRSGQPAKEALQTQLQKTKNALPLRRCHRRNIQTKLARRSSTGVKQLRRCTFKPLSFALLSLQQQQRGYDTALTHIIHLRRLAKRTPPTNDVNRTESLRAATTTAPRKRPRYEFLHGKKGGEGKRGRDPATPSPLFSS